MIVILFLDTSLASHFVIKAVGQTENIILAETVL